MQTGFSIGFSILGVFSIFFFSLPWTILICTIGIVFNFFLPFFRPKLSFPVSFFLHLLVFVGISSLRITNETFLFFEEDPHALVYDALSAAFLRGEASMAAVTCQGECFFPVNLETGVVYFGGFPAFFRIPLLLLFPEYEGSWHRISVLVAGILSASFVLLLLDVLSERLIHSSARLRLFLFHIGAFTILYTLPFYFPFGSGSIYYEANVWGIAGFICCLLCFELAEFEPTRRNRSYLFVSSLAAGIALLSRLTFMLSAIPIVLVLFLRQKQKLKSIWLTFPLVFALAFQAWYNFARFGSVFETLPYSLYCNYQWRGPGFAPATFDLSRIPVHGSVYFTLLDAFDRLILIPTPKGSSNIAFGEPFSGTTASLPTVVPLLFILSIYGLFLFLFSNRISLARQVVAGGTLLQGIMLLTYNFATSRYLPDFVPALLFLGVCLPLQARIRISNQALRRVALGCCLLLTIYSISASLYGTLYFNSSSWMVARQYRKELKSRRKRIDRLILGLADSAGLSKSKSKKREIRKETKFRD